MGYEHFTRRQFVKFMGGVSIAAASAPFASVLNSCSTIAPTGFPFKPLDTAVKDQVLLAEGLSYQVLIEWGQKLNNKGELFGFNNDYLAFIPLKGKNNEGILWVNHEYPDPYFVSGYRGGDKSRYQVDQERASVGGSLLHLIRDSATGRWKVKPNSKYNRRLDGTTKIPLVTEHRIRGELVAEGTLGNCAGGVTPWNTILTCEENYQDFYGEVDFKTQAIKRGKYRWDVFYANAPEHYGWVVEVDPLTGRAKKLTALGRFSHECATCVLAPDGRVVVYTGDDKADEFIYKFISEKPGSLERGELFVANLEQGKWISLNYDKQPLLREHFKHQTEVLTYCRQAARLLGATPCARPEDFEVHPKHGDVYVSLTMNPDRGNHFGSILRIQEKDSDPRSLEFVAEDFLMGGKDQGLACPDNLMFDKQGNLWITTDIPGSDLNQGVYQPFGNNGLYYVPMTGEHAGRAMRIATAPIDAEFTGPYLSPDEQTLFLSVQHPGEMSPVAGHLTSHWPGAVGSTPKPAVIQIFGPTLDKLLGRV